MIYISNGINNAINKLRYIIKFVCDLDLYPKNLVNNEKMMCAYIYCLVLALIIIKLCSMI